MITTTSNVSKHPHTGRVVLSGEELEVVLTILEAAAMQALEKKHPVGQDLARIGLAIIESASQDQEDSESYRKSDHAYL